MRKHDAIEIVPNKARFRARRQRELVSVLKVRGKEDCLGRVQGLNFFSKDVSKSSYVIPVNLIRDFN